MSKRNQNLNNAKKKQDDEYYTPYESVADELGYYHGWLKGKIIYCNTDSAESNFVKYFQNNYNAIQYKELIYTSSDFRSEENIENLKKADVVITNPPFSLLTEYVIKLFEFEKDFLIMIPLLAISQPAILPQIVTKKLLAFKPIHKIDFIHEDGIKNVQVLWLTTIRTQRKLLKLAPLYPHYDNYDAIDVSSIKLIKRDYDGVQGVPITFLLYPKLLNEFELLELKTFDDLQVEGKNIFRRLLIKRQKTDGQNEEPEPSSNA